MNARSNADLPVPGAPSITTLSPLSIDVSACSKSCGIEIAMTCTFHINYHLLTSLKHAAPTLRGRCSNGGSRCYYVVQGRAAISLGTSLFSASQAANFGSSILASFRVSSCASVQVIR